MEHGNALCRRIGRPFSLMRDIHSKAHALHGKWLSKNGTMRKAES